MKTNDTDLNDGITHISVPGAPHGSPVVTTVGPEFDASTFGSNGVCTYVTTKPTLSA
ncbi:hypothetical protein [Catellatospora sichuanensis]|uniref:hypothetical protein n=1 Tax=Catellatospora sichuanensis TaxID=1969805 RepID=UPI001642CCC1|nr:hypothetical protein [Catellatospora sichuanensis]